MDRIVVKCTGDENVKSRWKQLCAKLDADATQEEIMHQLCTYFESDNGDVADVRAANKGPRFR